MNPDWQTFLTSQGARVENGLVRAFASATGTQADALLADLSHEGIIAVEGPDARAFLQGQLSTDIDALTPDLSQLSSWSTAKGRVVAVLRIVPDGDRILLILPRALLASVLKRLTMYVLRAKVTLTDVSDGLAHFGLAGNDAVGLLAAAQLGVPPAANSIARTHALQVIRLHGKTPRFVILGNTQTLSAAWLGLTRAGAQPVTDNEWALQTIRAGEPAILPETSERFVAQMIGLEELDAVNFRKGCYIGQEIIARAHFRGTVKRHLLHARCDSIAGIAPGTAIENTDSGQAVGEVVDARLNSAGFQEMLIVLQDDHRNDTLRLAGNGPSLRIERAD